MDDEGADPDALDRILAKPEVKAFYTIPSFHNPLGTSTSLARRKEILRVAERHGVPILEHLHEHRRAFGREQIRVELQVGEPLEPGAVLLPRVPDECLADPLQHLLPVQDHLDQRTPSL